MSGPPKLCCPHPVERHAYKGCADCGCNVRWTEHPDRERDPEFKPIGRARLRLGIPVDNLFVAGAPPSLTRAGDR